MVLKTHTNMKGLSGPSQLTRLKLKMRMMKPIISNTRMCFRTKALTVDMGYLGRKFWRSIPASLWTRLLYTAT